MNTASDRRAPGATRIPFEAMVEVGGALGPSFEAQAVNLSEDGMQLRTAYLPEIGQPVTCRFDAGQGMIVVAAGEVLWNEPTGDGGEFGIRFTNLDGQSTAALQRIMGLGADGSLPRPPHGRRVRLHIEGLASPMRARVKGAEGASVTAYSELGFLQVGKPLDLEDASTGSKRPALIDRVDVEIESESRIPQLVVTLRYDDEEARADAMSQDEGEVEITPRDPVGEVRADDDAPGGSDEDVDEPAAAPEADAAPAPSAAAKEASDETVDDVSPLKSAFARGAAKVGPALEKLATRAKTTMALIAARRKGGSGDDVEIPIRRTTAPAPGGGLHASGRKVIRGEIGEGKPAEPASKPRLPIPKKKAAIAGAIALAAVLAYVGFRKPAAPPPLAAAPAPEVVMPPDTIAPSQAAEPIMDPLAAAAAAGGDAVDDDGAPAPVAKSTKKVRATPFGNGPVGSRANVLRLKMDGAIEKIQGASQPTGFTVVIPNRKSLDAAAPLAAKDPRIAAIRVANEASGAELTVTFKDGVPNYLVRARGETLELVLARPNANGSKAPEANAKTTKKKSRKKPR